MSQKKRLLVVFDIDETLIHFLPKNKIGNTNWKDMSDEDKSQFQYVLDGDHVVFLRPYLCELFRFFNANQDKYAVALWTYSEREYADGIASMISEQCGFSEDLFLFKWGAEDIDDEDYPKNLNNIWSEFSDFNKFNTIIVDDLHGNIRHEHNVENSILIQPYAPFGRDKKRKPMTDEMRKIALSDDALDQLKGICEVVSKDIVGCDDEDIEASFTKESVFSPKRITRMGLNKYLKKYAIKFVMLPAIGESYQTNRFIDVTRQAEMYGEQQHGGKKKSRKHKKSRKSKRSKTKKTKRIRKGGVSSPNQRTWQRNEDDGRNHPVILQLVRTIASDTHTNITRSFLRAYINYDILLNVYLSTPTPEEGYNYAQNYFIALEIMYTDYLRTIVDTDEVRDFYETFSPAIDLDNPNSAVNRHMRRLNEDRVLIDEGRNNRGLAYYEEIRRLREVITSINENNRLVSDVGGKRSKKSKTRRRVKKRKNKKTRK